MTEDHFNMTADRIEQLVMTGLKLVADLETAAENYHVKSDHHEILRWEASIVKAKLQHLQDRAALPENLCESCLLGEWGRRVQDDLPELAERVMNFHRSHGGVVAGLG